ncbi:MAG: S8 family serine peptidase, partial [Gemmatimonadota bacterium]
LEPGDTLVEAGGSKRVVQGTLEAVTGVAPGAEWVAANAFEFFGGAPYTRLSVLLQSLQWAVDPDGDPFTVSDIPDVVNNSWGFPTTSCDRLFDRAIDALELIGVPVVFAAGNRSSGLDTVATPASRADLLLNAFSVGAAEERDGEIVVAENSLGGPSPCAPGAVKPEVVAPGVVPLVRNEGPFRAGVAGRSGPFTSWASPHVTGSLAVLKGLNPSAGANDLKDALFSTAKDLPPAGFDNRSGAGFIDLVAAVNRIGGLGGVNLDVVSWSWDAGGATLRIELFNSGVSPFPGGVAELSRSVGGEALAQAMAPLIGSRDRAAIVFAGLSADPTREARLQVRLESDGAVLELPVSLRATSATAVRIEDGSVQFSLDASGRLGRVAGPPGFFFLDRDWLTAGAFLVAAGDRVSDAAYVEVLGQPALKSNPVGSDTDWSGRVLEAGVSNVRLEYGDSRALRPIGATVEQSALLISIGDSAAFVLLSVTIAVARAGEIPMMGLLLDWDFGGRERVFWSDDLAASVMTPLDSAGPWMALTTAPQAPTTHAAVPIGEPVLGFFDFGSGVLADTVCQESTCSLAPFSDETKARFLRLGGDQTSSSRISDWAQLVTVGPLGQRETIGFVVAAGGTESALRVALDSARALADQLGSVQQVASASSLGLDLLPAFPNPFDPTAGEIVNLPFLVSRGSSELRAVLEIFTIAGRLVYSETRDVPADAPLEPFRWDGRLSNGDVAGTGVYGYVLQVGNEKRSGKMLLLK